MTRTYDRETKHYDFALLSHLVETGQATFFDGPSIYVIKTEDGTVAVRPHQVIFTATPAPFTIVVSPMDGYHGQEKYDGEDTGPGGVVYDSMLDLAGKYLGDNLEGTDPLAIVRRMLDDESFEKMVIDEVTGGTAKKPRRRNGWVSANEADELLAHFSR